MTNRYSSEELPVVPVAYQPMYAPMPVRGEMLGSFDNVVRTGVTEKLIELVERQSAEIGPIHYLISINITTRNLIDDLLADVLRQEVNRLSLRVAELARVGFPHTLELKLDGRVATYHLGPSPSAAAAPVAAPGTPSSAYAPPHPHHTASHPSTPSSVSFAPHVSSPLAAAPPPPVVGLSRCLLAPTRCCTGHTLLCFCASPSSSHCPCIVC